MNLCEIPAVWEQTCLFFSGAVLRRHVYLITDGVIVTSSITLYQYKCYVIIISRKSYLSIYWVKVVVFSAPIYWAVVDMKLCKIEMVSLCFEIFLAKWNVKKLLFCNLISWQWKIALPKQASNLLFALAQHFKLCLGKWASANVQTTLCNILVSYPLSLKLLFQLSFIPNPPKRTSSFCLVLSSLSLT